MTVSAIVFGEAPGYWPLTTTVGGTISGYSLIGSTGIASRPATVIRMASTVANIGLSMKNDEIFIAAASTGRRRSGARHGRAHRDPLGSHGHAGMHALGAVHHDHVSRLQSLAYDAQTLDDAAEFHLAVLDLIVGAEQQHVLLVLIGVDGAILDQDGRIFAAHQQLHPFEQAGRELSVLVLQHGPRADRSGLRIELIVDEIEASGMREPVLVGQADLHGI